MDISSFFFSGWPSLARILLVGAPDWWGTHLGQSIYLRELHGPMTRGLRLYP